MSEKIPVWNHASVRVQDPNGNYHTITACKLTGGDVNDDGTVNMPPSGECDCYDAMEPATGYQIRLTFKEWMGVASALSASENTYRAKDMDGMANQKKAIREKIAEQLESGSEGSR